MLQQTEAVRSFRSAISYKLTSDQGTIARTNDGALLPVDSGAPG